MKQTPAIAEKGDLARAKPSLDIKEVSDLYTARTFLSFLPPVSCTDRARITRC